MTSLDDSQLIQTFEDCSLPFTEWNHRTHLKIAYIYLCNYSFDETLVKLHR